MSDLIDRQMAIDAIEKHIDTFDAIDTNYLDGLRTAMSLLHELPSAQPERKGMWIHERVNSEHSVTGYFILRSCECSECGAICEQESNFCPVCGSDMRGNDE